MRDAVVCDFCGTVKPFDLVMHPSGSQRVHGWYVVLGPEAHVLPTDLCSWGCLYGFTMKANDKPPGGAT